MQDAEYKLAEKQAKDDEADDLVLVVESARLVQTDTDNGKDEGNALDDAVPAHHLTGAQAQYAGRQQHADGHDHEDGVKA
ncbi:hypothetical protein BN1708_000653 [Verticillium longisporum]|uniref:Uncharacterized protein n=1 Tax=Verticillium longisporum TaxID=100787 RepID=A0A0G4LXP1_VERLO|nr:hypothetical protein BN1708_000653 [Verticillium longisporum]